MAFPLLNAYFFSGMEGLRVKLPAEIHRNGADQRMHEMEKEQKRGEEH